jgi:putative DNA methylase
VTPYKKKLIEVAIPLEAINAASAREKSIRHGHPSTLHLWWARRPLAACRAVLFAQLVDDPSSRPDQFPTAELQDAERKRLFAIIEDLVKWENSTNEEVLERARAEIRRSCGGVLPPVYDPFSGGGSIPLEAQRLGLPAYGSDLNPVAVMIGKAMIEIPPKFKDQKPIHPGVKARIHYRNAEGLAEDVKYYGEWMREKAWERIGHLYPQVDLPIEFGSGQAKVVGWIWSRTVPSPDPAFSDAFVPIASSFLLNSRAGQEVWVEPIVDKVTKTISYEIRHGGTKAEINNAASGTKSGRANFFCLLSDSAITAEYIKKKGQNSELSDVLIAIVAEGKGGRIYVAPNDMHVLAAATDSAHQIAEECRRTYLSGGTPARLTGGTCYAYGLNQWGILFTDRQVVVLNAFSDLVHEVRDQIERDGLSNGLSADGIPLRLGGTASKAYAEAVAVQLGMALSRLADSCNAHCRWAADKTQLKNLFSRQAIPMSWDFFEANPFAGGAGDFLVSATTVAKALERWTGAASGSIRNYDAQTVKYPKGAVISTDPPYYDNISYADLSDFFFCWMRRVQQPTYPDQFGLLATPKSEELVATAYRHGGRESAESFFLNGMSKAIANMAFQTAAEFPSTIYYAFKQSEIDQEGISSTGWATFLQAVVEAGYAVVGTWPMRTEMANRMVASGTNALANSVVLVCRKKEASAESITRAEFIRALKRELPSAIKELQAASIAPADMPQSAIGPGMGVFSRHRAVLESDDSPMSVKTALQLINRELDEYLGGIQGEFDADTRFAITWFEQNGLKAGDYGTAASIAQARGISVDSVKHAGIVESQAGKVRIFRRDELDAQWEPGTDQHLTIWECLQHLVRLHEKDGISHAAVVLLKKIGDKADAAKDLAYILYDISANKRQDAKEATAYNALIADWSELSRQAAAMSDDDARGERQIGLDL